MNAVTFRQLRLRSSNYNKAASQSQQRNGFVYCERYEEKQQVRYLQYQRRHIKRDCRLSQGWMTCVVYVYKHSYIKLKMSRKELLPFLVSYLLVNVPITSLKKCKICHFLQGKRTLLPNILFAFHRCNPSLVFYTSNTVFVAKNVLTLKSKYVYSNHEVE